MDRAFLDYYEEELSHVRALAAEFADMHPSVARNLSLDTVPCPDPYVERLLDGVAYLAARTRLKVDAERSRFARAVLDAVYPDLVAPTPSMAMAVLAPGRQVQTMLTGHPVRRGSRMVSALRPGLATRSTWTTAQDVTLWPVEIAGVTYLQDRAALSAAGIAVPGAAAALVVTLARVGKGTLADLSLDRLDVHFRDRAKAPALFDAVFGQATAIVARPEGKDGAPVHLPKPSMIGIADAEALLPPTRAGLGGYRLLREYFAMPERFHFMRVDGLKPAVGRCGGRLEVAILFQRTVSEIADTAPGDFALFATPIVNLFEKDCTVFEVDPRRTRQVVHADRTRPRDFEIVRALVVEDAEADGPEAEIPSLFSLGQNRGSGWTHALERRPRRPTEDERRQGQTRTSYVGDDVFLSLSRPQGRTAAKPIRRVSVTALCTNRDIPILDDTPTLLLETGDPVEAIQLIGALRPPRPAIPAALPTGVASESRADELAWRLVSQLSLNFMSLAEEGRGVDPLHALLDLYADRGDPGLARHVRSITRVASKPVVERLPIAGPLCFGRGTEITLDVDQSQLAGHATLLLSALLSRLFARHVAVNSFVRTRTRLIQRQEDVSWPMTPGDRGLI
jgi:type VI secretion system protein ImpG